MGVKGCWPERQPCGPSKSWTKAVNPGRRDDSHDLVCHARQGKSLISERPLPKALGGLGELGRDGRCGRRSIRPVSAVEAALGLSVPGVPTQPLVGKQRTRLVCERAQKKKRRCPKEKILVTVARRADATRASAHARRCHPWPTRPLPACCVLPPHGDDADDAMRVSHNPRRGCFPPPPPGRRTRSPTGGGSSTSGAAATVRHAPSVSSVAMAAVDQRM